MKESETIDILTRVAANYPNVTVTNEMVQLYTETLDDVPYNVALRNVTEHIKTSKFAPTIAEIRGGYTDAHERQKRETQAFIREQEARKPIPVPAHIKERMDKLFGRQQAEKGAIGHEN